MSTAAVTPSTSTSPIEHILIATAVLAGSLCLVVWGGATVSSLASGRGAPGVGLGDSLRAIPALVDNPSVPAAAWPAGSRSQIPAPAIY